MAKKKSDPSAHGIIARSKYYDLDKWVIAVLCTTINQHAIATSDPSIFDRLRKEIENGEKEIDAMDAAEGKHS